MIKTFILGVSIALALPINSHAQMRDFKVVDWYKVFHRSEDLSTFGEGTYYDGVDFGRAQIYHYGGSAFHQNQIVHSSRGHKIRSEFINVGGSSGAYVFSDTLYRNESSNVYYALIPSQSVIVNYEMQDGTVSLLHVFSKDKARMKAFSNVEFKQFESWIEKTEASIKEEIELIQDAHISKGNKQKVAKMKLDCAECLVQSDEVLSIAKKNFNNENALVNAYIDTKKNNEWEVIKNDYNLILKRRKPAYVYYKDHDANCFLQYVYVIQDYSGAGTYGSSYIKYEAANQKNCEELEGIK